MIIDLLITKDNDNFRLSDLGMNVKDIEETSPSLDIVYRTVTNRSRRTRSNSRYDTKIIRVRGDFYVDSIYDYEKLKDEFYGRMVETDSYYITKMLPVEEELYGFELPGESTNDIDTLNAEHRAYHYRYDVVMYAPTFTFIGRSAKGLLFDFDLEFETDTIPFGETEAKNITITDTIDYGGTAEISQLEHPWYVKLTASTEQAGDFYFTIGDRTFVHTSLTPIAPGDVFELRGVETRLNHYNINEYTNYEHFIIKPGSNEVQTDFSGSIEIINYKEFYK